MIGILGGAFDPVHHGHLRLALEAAEALDLAEVRLIPLNIPPHRDPPLAPAALRLEMLKAAAGAEPRLQVDDRELRRGGVSYTVDTLISLREEFKDQPLCLILGMDAFSGLTRWHQWQRLPALAHIIIAQRPGNSSVPTANPDLLLEGTTVKDTDALRQKSCGAYYKLTAPMLDISSSHIRALIRAGRSPRYLLPDPVIELMGHHRLYL